MPFDMRMPDGTIIRGVPDDISQAELRRLGQRYAAPSQQRETAERAPVATRPLGRMARESGTPARTAAPTGATPQQLAARSRELDAEEQRLQSSLQAYDTLRNNPFAGPGMEAMTIRRSQDAARLEAIQRERQVMQEQGRIVPRLTGGERAAEMARALPREAIRGVASVGGAAGIFGPGGEEVARGIYEGGEGVVRGLGLEQSERTREALEYDPYTGYASTLTGGIGSTVPFLATSILGGTAKAAALARGAPTAARVLGGATTATNVALGSGVGATEARERMDQWERETGQTLDPETRQLVTAGGSAIGLMELLPLGAMLNRAPGPVRQAVSRTFTPIIESAAARRIAPEAAQAAVRQGIQRLESTAAGRMFTRGFIPEGAQEGTSQLLQNILEGTYDPNQAAFEGVLENALLGGLVGGTIRGGTEAVGSLSRRVAEYKSSADRDIASIQGDAPAPVTFDIIERDQADPSRTVRSTVEVLNLEGDRATIRRPDGNIQRLPTAVLESRIAPEGDYAGFATPESFSADNIRERLFGTIAGVKGEESGQLQSYADAVSLRVSNALSFGEPTRALNELNRMEQRFTADQRKKGKKAEPSAIADPRQNILSEARSIITDYQAEFGKSQAKGVTVGTEQAAPKTGTIADMLERNIAARRAEDAQRAELLKSAINREDIGPNPHEWFSEQIESRGFYPVTLEEAATIRDATRLQAQLETATAKGQQAIARENQIKRWDIIEPVLADANVSNDQKANKINADLERAGMQPLTEDEARTVYGAAVAEDVFGPAGRMDTQRKAILDEVMADESIPANAKVREFNARLEEVPELAAIAPTEEEVAALSGTADIEAEIEQADIPVKVRAATKRISQRNQLLNQISSVPTLIQRVNKMVEKKLLPEKFGSYILSAVRTEKAPAKTSAIAPTATAAEDIEVDYDAHPLMQEHEARYDDALEEVNSAENGRELRSTINRFKRDGLIDEDDIAEINERINDAGKDPEDRLYEGISAVEDALENQRDNIRYDIESQIDEEMGVPDTELIATPESEQREAYLDTKYEVGYMRLLDALDRRNAADQEIIDAERAATPAGGGVRGAAARAVPARPGMARPSVPADGVTDGGQPLDIALTEGEPASTEEAIARLEERRAELEAAPAAEEVVGETITEEAAPEPTPTPAPEQNAAYEPGSVESQMADSPNTNKPLTVGLMANFQARFGKILRTLRLGVDYKYQDAVDYSKQLARAFGVETLPPDMNLSRRFEMFESRKSGNQQRLIDSYVQPIYDLLVKLNVDPQDVGMYLWARSAKDRNKLVAARNTGSPDKGSGLTDAEAEAILQHFETAENGDLLPKLKQIAKKHDQLVDYMLNMRVKEGLLTREQAQAARASQPFYASLKGFADDGDMQLVGEQEVNGLDRYKKDGAVSKFTNQIGTRLSEFTQSKGRRSMPLNPLFNLSADAQQLIAHVETNRVGRTLLQNIRENPDEHRDIARVYTAADAKKMRKVSGDIAYPDGTLVKANMQQEMLKGNLMVVKEGGKVYFIEFANTDAGTALKRAFSNMTPGALRKFINSSKIASTAVGAVTGTAIGLKSVLTRYNPFYLPVAYLRDNMDAVLTAYAAQKIKGGPAEGKKLGKKVAKYLNPTNSSSRAITTATAAYVRGKEPKNEAQAKLMLLLDQMIEDGGSVGHVSMLDTENTVKQALRSIKYARSLERAKKFRPDLNTAPAVVAAVGDAMNATAQIIDLNARFATYAAALDLGVNREDAAALALDSSLNLTRRGEWAPLLDTIYFFTSPTIGSARKLIRTGTKGGVKYLGTVAALGAISALWNMWMGGDDEDEDGQTNYQEVPEYIKQTRLVFFYGSGADDYLSIPVGFLLALPKYIGETVTNTGMGVINSPETAGVQLTDATAKLATGFFAALSPLRVSGEDAETFLTSVMPSPTKPFTDLVANRNYFNSPIYNEKNEYDTRLASELGRAGTSDFYKWIARSMNSLTGGGEGVPGWLDKQPEWYQYIVRQYGGGVEKTVRQSADLVSAIRSGELTEDPDKSVMEQIPVLNVFFGRGSEYTPMNEYYANTEESAGRPSMDNVRRYTDRDTEGISREQREAFVEENESDYPYMFDRRVIRAYEDADKALDDMYKRRREDRSTTADADALRAVNDSYEEEARQIYTDFNRVFYEVKREYDAQ